jgi:hypothetical protein
MVWSQYVDETRIDSDNETETSEEELIIPRNKPMEYDTWVSWYYNDLMNMWMHMKTYREDTSCSQFILDKGEFEDFCEFCYHFSCKRPSGK